MIQTYLKALYQRAMHEAYSLAHNEIAHSLREGGKCLDCGANSGYKYSILRNQCGIERNSYYGIEWNKDLVSKAQKKNLNVLHRNLNKGLQFPDNEFKCIFGLSVLEHLLNPCKYLTGCYRALDQDGCLVRLTPNISTYFTAALILAGKMPSSGPHPDSDQLLKQEELYKVSHESLHSDAETDTPAHRHIVVFSYKILISYVKTLGFSKVKGYGFGLYPFPNFMQPILEKVDPYH